jgi:hypothetical protein
MQGGGRQCLSEICECPAHAKTTIPSGGSVAAIECGCPAIGIGSASLHQGLQIADERFAVGSGATARSARRDERLVPGQHNRARAPRPAEIDPALVQENRAVAPAVRGLLALAVPPGNVGQTVNELRELAHRDI